MVDDVIYSVTGNPFVDTGQAVIAHLAGKESFTQMTHGDVKRVFESGDGLADWNSRLKSFTMVFGNNGPLYQPRGKQHEDSRKKKYASILAGLLDQIENTNPDSGTCECCGEFPACDLDAAYEQVEGSNSNYDPTHSNCRDRSLNFLLSKRITSRILIFDQTKCNPNQLIFQSDKQNYASIY